MNTESENWGIRGRRRNLWNIEHTPHEHQGGGLCFMRAQRGRDGGHGKPIATTRSHGQSEFRPL
ncbi:GM19281 [Drosophila sechellia]|uniref:GM19281 n=1 Tax=Drosophila sechellia TaxID=7238 RepID=B4IIK2_DROSE|nr:GM19281 [Drosophila sechellia]